MTTATRTFTIEEANRTLPYVRRVVSDLVRDFGAWKDTLARYELAAAEVRATEDASDDSGEAARLEQEAAALASAIESYIAEIAAVGAEVKGFADGLVDFPAESETGRPILWCWRLGEPSIQHWHEVDAGFAGRRPLAALGTESNS